MHWTASPGRRNAFDLCIKNLNLKRDKHMDVAVRTAAPLGCPWDIPMATFHLRQHNRVVWEAGSSGDPYERWCRLAETSFCCCDSRCHLGGQWSRNGPACFWSSPGKRTTIDRDWHVRVGCARMNHFRCPGQSIGILGCAYKFTGGDGVIRCEQIAWEMIMN